MTITWHKSLLHFGYIGLLHFIVTGTCFWAARYVYRVLLILIYLICACLNVCFGFFTAPLDLNMLVDVACKQEP